MTGSQLSINNMSQPVTERGNRHTGTPAHQCTNAPAHRHTGTSVQQTNTIKFAT